MSELGTEIRLTEGFDAAIDRVTAALAAQGFGVISRIDMDKAVGFQKAFMSTIKLVAARDFTVYAANAGV